MINVRRYRIILFTLGLFAVGLVSIVTAWQVGLIWGLPDVPTADREGVLRWLVCCDLREETPDLQQKLLARIEVVFDGETELSGADQLDDQQRSRLSCNIGLLKEVWFRQKVDEFYATAQGDRSDFLDRQIETLLRWAAIDAAIAGNHSTLNASEQMSGYLSEFLDTIDGWIARTKQSEQQRARDVVKSGLIRWLATQDLSRESQDVKRRIVFGLEGCLGGQIEIDDSTAAFHASEVQQFWKNVILLAEIWFGEKATQFARLPSDQQAEFVNRQAGFIESLFYSSKLADESTRTTLLKNIDIWINSATDKTTPTKSQLQLFSQNLRAGLMVRHVKRLFLSDQKRTDKS